jgi:hypothetical protein
MTTTAKTPSLAQSTSSRRGTTDRVARIMPVAHSPVTSRTPSTPTASCALVGAASANGLASAVGATWPPPPVLSVRALLNLALTKSGLAKHVFVLVLENRSFDHMLGASTGTVDARGTIRPGTGADAVTGEPTTVNATVGQVNISNGTAFRVRAGGPFVMPVDPPHEFCDVQAQLAGTGITGNPLDDKCDYSGTDPPVTMVGFVDSYARQATVEAASTDAGTQQAGQAALADLGAVIACLTAAQVPVLSTPGRPVRSLRPVVFGAARPHLAEQVLPARRDLRRPGPQPELLGRAHLVPGRLPVRERDDLQRPRRQAHRLACLPRRRPAASPRPARHGPVRRRGALPRSQRPGERPPEPRLRRRVRLHRAQLLAARPVGASLRGFVEIAAMQDLHLGPHERERVQQRVRAIRTLGDACDYIAVVAAQLPTASPGGAAKPGETARQPQQSKQ